MTFLHPPSDWGCRCGAGRASLLVRFAVDGPDLVLAALEARVVRTAADLVDVDFFFLPGELLDGLALKDPVPVRAPAAWTARALEAALRPDDADEP